MTAETFPKVKTKAAETTNTAITTGPAVASMISAGLGVFTIGLMTTLAEASEGVKNALNLSAPVGPLSGKTTTGIIVWLVAWLMLNLAIKNTNPKLSKAFAITIALIIAGLLLTFPPFFEAFAAE